MDTKTMVITTLAVSSIWAAVLYVERERSYKRGFNNGCRLILAIHEVDEALKKLKTK